MRSGDIFSSSPHKSYVQPPLSYYKNIAKDYNTIKLICEDNKNPCANELLKQSNVECINNTLMHDLTILSNAPNLVIGFGTFGSLLYLMNTKLKNLYINKLSILPDKIQIINPTIKFDYYLNIFKKIL